MMGDTSPSSVYPVGRPASGQTGWKQPRSLCATWRSPGFSRQNRRASCGGSCELETQTLVLGRFPGMACRFLPAPGCRNRYSQTGASATRFPSRTMAQSKRRLGVSVRSPRPGYRRAMVESRYAFRSPDHGTLRLGESSLGDSGDQRPADRLVSPRISAAGRLAREPRLAPVRGRGLGGARVGERNRDGKPRGRYTPFTFDITEQVQPGESATVVVRVFDPTDRHLPTGKQVAYWYTFTSGIWQTVWLEARPARYLGSLSLIPATGRAIGRWRFPRLLKVSTAWQQCGSLRPMQVFLPAQGEVEIDHGSGEFRAELHVKSPQLWWPEDPNLYDLGTPGRRLHGGDRRGPKPTSGSERSLEVATESSLTNRSC